MKFKPFALAALLTAAWPAQLLAEDPADDPELKRLQLLKAQYEAATQAYAASKSKSEMEAAAASAKFGPLASYTTEGTIDVGTNSGKLEATLLAAEATRQSAQYIVRDLCQLLAKAPATTACGDEPGVQAIPKLLIYTDTNKPNFDAYQAFKAEEYSIEKELTRAKALQPGSRTGAISGSTFGPGAATLLSVAGNLLRSDYKLSSIDVPQGENLLVRTFVQEAKLGKLKSATIVPNVYSAPIDIENNPAIKDLNRIETLRNDVADRADVFRAQTAKKPKNKDSLDKVVAQMDAAVARFDTFAKQLGTPDDAGHVPLANVARQAQLFETVGEDARFLILGSEYAGGSAYSKKNFWTFLGGIPFFVSGGSLTGYTLLDGATGEVLYSSNLPQTVDFTAIDRATRRYARGTPASGTKAAKPN